MLEVGKVQVKGVTFLNSFDTIEKKSNQGLVLFEVFFWSNVKNLPFCVLYLGEFVEPFHLDNFWRGFLIF